MDLESTCRMRVSIASLIEPSRFLICAFSNAH